MDDIYILTLQPVDDRTNVLVLSRRSTGTLQGVHIRLNWWDKLIGRTLLDKSMSTYARVQKACAKANQEEEAKA